MKSSRKKVFRAVSPRVDSNDLERGILAYWEHEKVFEKSLEQNKDKPLFTFYDGPPYATGKPHYGHVLQSAIKDTVLRYKTMRGYYVPRRVGWDTHGLPVEVFVEKELGFKTKKDIERYGIEKFNQKCRETVHRYIDVWIQSLKRLGRWADYADGYSTLDRDYMESEWWVFQQLWDKGLVYQDFRSTPYCIRCATPLSNYETSEGYKDRTDTAVYVLLNISPTSLTSGELRGANQKLSLLVWTTTPWTLPANVAVAFNPNLEYVSVTHEGREIILAKSRVEAIFGSGVTIVRTWTSKELQELTYQPLYDAPTPSNSPSGRGRKTHTLVPADFVTTNEGTGLVHIAPAFGTEDHELARKLQLPIIRTVDTNGIFYKEVPQWGGQHIWKANPLITADLDQRGLLFKQAQYTHSYPHCWRCDEPLIYYALDTWFIRVADLKARMLAANEQINWIPEHIKHGRFAKGIESAPDWAIGRRRFWSVPIPVWQCDRCNHLRCIGSIAELQKLSEASDEAVADIHRPYVDELTWECIECKVGTMRRVSEVLDVWFDSGSMPYSQWHYPFENKQFVERGFPADFIAESIEMTRAWFYFLHVLAVGTMDGPAYKNVIGSGIIFGEDGNKLSKKLKNYPEIDPIIEKYGADTVRLFFLAGTLGEPYVFSEKELQQLFRNFTMTLWNVYSFFVGYANTAGFQPAESPKPSAQNPNMLDSWILARLHQLQHEVIALNDSYRLDSATRVLIAFVDDLSNWYVRRSRRRFQSQASAKERAAALSTLHHVLLEFTKLLAPCAPFVAEEIYRNLTGKESVHLEQLIESQETTPEEQALLNTMNTARQIVSQGLAARAAAKIKVRQPLARLVAPNVESLPAEVVQMIKDEVNVDEVAFGSELMLDTNITPDLRSRGIAREIIRHGQTLRRQAGYALDDRIHLILTTQDAELLSVIDSKRDEITGALQADDVQADGAADTQKEVLIEGKKVTIGVKKR